MATKTKRYGDTPADDGIRAAREEARAINRNADGSRSDTTNRVWVVSNPTPHSDLGDICFDADPIRLCQIMIGAGGERAVREEDWTFYTNEQSAKAEAERRLAARR